MKIPGTNIEIRAPFTFAQTGTKSVAIANTQETKPSVPLRRALPRETLGDSGTPGLHGIITEEYNPQLQGVQGIRVFDEMRKSDGTVRAALLACTLPIRRAKWFIKPASEEQADKDIANFVEHALFDWIEGMTWNDILRQALLMTAFGVMPFEKVYGTKDHEGKTYVTLEKLAPRHPRSIQQWELADGTFGVQQIRQDGVQAQIPGSKLLIFVNEREGDNWWGTSMIRAAYKHWYYKNNFYKIDGVAFERQGLGVPVIHMPEGYTDADERKAVTAMQNLRANENAYLVLPKGYEFEFADMGSSTTRDPEKSINHHNRQILISVLAQFLELGATEVGSKALSADHSELFMKAIESIANTICDEINRNLIVELVDLNFNDVENYPTIDFDGITKVDITSLGTTIATLVTAGGLKLTPSDMQYIRAALGLPPMTQDEMDEVQETLDKGGEADPNNPDEDAAIDDGEEDDAPEDTKKVDKAAKKKTAREHNHGPRAPRTFDDGAGNKWWRPLTFAEQKVNFKKIEDMMNQIGDEFTTEAKAALKKAKDAYMSKLHTALDSGDTKAVADLEVKFVNEYKTILKTAMKRAYEYGKNNASTEMGVPVPPNNAASLAEIDLLADTVATKTATNITTKAKLAAVSALKANKNALQAAGTIDADLEDAIAREVDQAASTLVGQNMNHGRNDVFERNSGMIYALQRSEILDKRTCNFCLSMDGLIVTPDDPWAKTDIFHGDCRGIWVEIRTDEQDPPDITGVPENLGDYFGGTVNDLVQPPRPILQKDSPAKDFVDEQKKKKDEE